LHDTANRMACITTVPALREKLVVLRMPMSHVGGYGERNRHGIELARSGGSANSPAVLQARVPGDSLCYRGGTAWVGASNLIGECPHILLIRALSGDTCSLPSPCPLLLVVQTLLLGKLKRRELHQQALALVPLAGAAEANHNGRKGRVLSAPPTERWITGR